MILYWSESPWPSIWAIRADGSHRHRILRNRQNAKRPRLSPDRKWVAFDGAPPGKEPLSDFDIQLVRRDGTGLRTLTTSSRWDTDAQWSPDGKTLSFTRMPAHPSGGSCRCWIWTVRRAGGGVKRLAQGQGARWSPDGKRLILTVPTESGAGDLYIIDADGSSRRRLTTAPALEFAAGFSRDGKKILFTRSPRENEFQVFVMKVDGTQARRLADGVAGGWSPDGSKILFTSSFSSPLFVMNADGSHRHKIVSVAASEPDWR
jgi:Tol biopolymer transport system component